MTDTPANRTANRLHSAAIHLLRRVRMVDRETDLSPERLSVLSILAYAGSKTVGQLAEMELVSAPAVSRTLTGLEREGLVIRERSAEDRRFVHVAASDKGRRLMEAARARRLQQVATMLGSLGDAEFRVLDRATVILEGLDAPARGGASRARESSGDAG